MSGCLQGKISLLFLFQIPWQNMPKYFLDWTPLPIDIGNETLAVYLC